MKTRIIICLAMFCLLFVGVVNAAIVEITSFEEFCAEGTLNNSVRMAVGDNLKIQLPDGSIESVGLDGTSWHIGFIDDKDYFVGFAKNVWVDYNGYEGWMKGRYSSELDWRVNDPEIYDEDGIPNDFIIVQDLNQNGIIAFYDDVVGDIWWDEGDNVYSSSEVLLGGPLPRYVSGDPLPSMTIVPEPATLVLLGLGSILLRKRN